MPQRPACPECGSEVVVTPDSWTGSDAFECIECGHEWRPDA